MASSGRARREATNGRQAGGRGLHLPQFCCECVADIRCGLPVFQHLDLPANSHLVSLLSALSHAAEDSLSRQGGVEALDEALEAGQQQQGGGPSYKIK